ncbi:TetR/AcrR family transcriptional regulator [Actinomyces faecalis]|uniref:TetR/AcrR family transcriptional regulator n=1 Tax=Actinomyces faecalis TaxID=2722820 RepID=UPI00155502F4|nr:TetR family transcriptional regulator [Actinomyces faecalis]
MSPRGRRAAGSPDAREAILRAARTAFAREGYNTSLRGIAREAGVDAALVHHYFPDRARLFIAAVTGEGEDTGISADAVASRLRQLPAEQMGEGLVRLFLESWTRAGPERFQAAFHAIGTDATAMAGLRDLMSGQVLEPAVAQVAPDRPRLRTQLVVSQVIGLGAALWVMELDALAGAGADALVALYGPMIQHYLTGELPSSAPGR